VKTARNVAIILALSALVYALPEAGLAANTLGWVVGVIFLGALAWFVSRLYREYQGQLFGLGDRARGILYGSVAVALLAVTATDRLWDTGVGVLVWFMLVGGASFGVFSVWQQSREY